MMEHKTEKQEIKNSTDAIARFLQEKGYQRIQLKAVLFDMDGVLFDSMKNHTLAWYQAVSERNIPCKREEFYGYEGATGKWTVNHLFQQMYHREATEDEVEQIYAAKSRYFNNLPQAAAMPGAARLLEQVKEKGLIPVLVTGSGQRSLLERLEKTYPKVFTPETMVTAFDVQKGKPDPEPYLQGIKKVGIQPWEAMVVENAPLGVQAAAAAGIFTVAVNTGPLPEEELWKAGANLVYSGMPALETDFKKLYSLCQITQSH